MQLKANELYNEINTYIILDILFFCFQERQVGRISSDRLSNPGVR